MANEIEIRIEATGAPEAVKAIEGVRVAARELQGAAGGSAAHVSESIQRVDPAPIAAFEAQLVTLTEQLGTLGKAVDQGADRLKDVVPPEAPKKVKDLTSQLDTLSGRMESIGRDLSVGLTAPLVGAGAASTKLSVDFDTSLTKIETLVGSSRQQVDAWRHGILDLTAEVGKTPGELAEGLFVVTSAGERGAHAMDVLEQAAEASSIGLGKTATIARTTTAAMQAYASSNLTAQRATEIMVATAREGNFEVEQLAGSLGQVLPIASAVGVSFDQVGGFIASMTRVNGDASASVTALRSFLQSLLTPSTEAEKTLQKVGLSMAALRAEVRDKGLSATLLHLIGLFDGNAAALARVIPNIEGLVGALATAGVQADSFQEVSENIRNSAGILETAFQRVQESPGFKLDQAIANVSRLAVTLGDELVPVVVDVVEAGEPAIEFLEDAVHWFAELPAPVRDTIGVMGGLAIAVGPVTYLLGSQLRLVLDLTKAYKEFRAARAAAAGVELATSVTADVTALSTLSGLVVVGGGLLVGLGALAAAFDDVSTRAEQTADEVEDAVQRVQAAIPTMDAAQLQSRRDAVDQQARELYPDLLEKYRSMTRLADQGAAEKGRPGHAVYLQVKAAYEQVKAQYDGLLELSRSFHAEMDHLNTVEGITIVAPGKKKGGIDFGDGDENPLQQAQDHAQMLLSLYKELETGGQDTAAVFRALVAEYVKAEESLRRQGNALSENRSIAQETVNDLTKALFQTPTPSVATEGAAPPVGAMILHPVAKPAGAVNRDWGLAPASKEFQQAAQIVVSSLGAMAQAAIVDSSQMEQAVVTGLANIAAAAVSASNPILGTAITAVGGLIGALFGSRRHSPPVPVRLEEYGGRALQQRQKKEGPDVVTIQILDSSSGELLSETQYQLGRNTRRDAVPRVPRTRS